MQLDCARCGRILEFSGERPSFCGFCGSPLPREDSDATAEMRTAVTPPRLVGNEVAAHPQVIGGYRLLRPLGEGGMGTVYEAEDSTSGRHVAVKLIAPRALASAEAVDRFRQEGRLASGIAHPRCVFVLAADEEAGIPYIVMELMPGTTLKDLVAEKGPLPASQAIALILDVMEGLDEAHRQGVIHRDVKPSNCFLQADNRVKVGDFGLSKSLSANNPNLTKTGTFLGTPLFASPEQVRSEPLDPRTDVYSVAATLYFLLTGRAPFEGGDAANVLARLAADPVPPMRSLRPELPGELDRVVLRGLERQRERRWQCLEEFRAALTPFIPGQLSFGGLGLRLGASLLDLPFVWALGSLPILMAWMFDWGTQFAFLDPGTMDSSLVGQLLELLPIFLYFTLLEGLWGKSLGKAWLRLRVCSVDGQQAPGMRRASLRTVVFLAIAYGPSAILTCLLAATMHEDPWWLALSLGSFLAGLIVVACPMRAGNGYRGLHELLSGTRVIHLPWKVRRKNYAGQTDLAFTQPEGIPRQLGPFTVQGALCWNAAGKVLQGLDPVLRRRVWLWLRPVSAPSLSTGRLELARATRLRWLTGGKHGNMQWEAFVAPTGCQLAEAIAGGGPWSWTEARPLLEDLCLELTLALAEGSLPLALTLDHIWVQSNGRLQLVDLPLPEAKRATAEPADVPGLLHLLGQAAAVIRADLQMALRVEKNVLRLLGQAAALILEGKPRDPDQPAESFKAPLPDHVHGLLDRLVGVTDPYRELTEFQEALEATAHRPTEVTRARRAGQLVLFAVFFCVGAANFLVPFRAPSLAYLSELERHTQAREKALARVQDTASLDLAIQSINISPQVRLAGLAQWHADLDLEDRLRTQVLVRYQEQAGWESSLSFWERGLQGLVLPPKVEPMGQGKWDSKATARKQAENYLARDFHSDFRFGRSLLIALGVVVFWPTLWILWAFLTRGGLTFRMTGLRLVRTDGCAAARWQCALRIALFWLPILPLLLGSALLHALFFAHGDPHPAGLWAALPWMSWVLWWGAVLILPAYVVLTLWNPSRSWADRRVGTCLVPR